MFFFNRKYYLSLKQAIRFAIFQHQASVLNHLLTTHGAPAFAKAISHFSGRLIADALTMLTMQARQAIVAHLSTSAKYKLYTLDRDLVHTLTDKHTLLAILHV